MSGVKVVMVVLMLGAVTKSMVASPYSVAADTETLQLVQVIFRHGDRAPTNTYPNDPVNHDPTAWPEGHSQLTSIGKMQQYHLGQYLRRRYNGFLAEKYHSEELYVVSSDMDRTIMSVESNLAGLFPPVHKWHPHLDWQPIPLRTIPWKEDQYLHVNIKCPKYDQLHHDFLQNSDVVQTINEENKDFVSHLSTESGLKASTVKEIISLQDIILTETIHNFTVIPQWAVNALPHLNLLQAQINTWSTYTEPMKRLHGGPLLQLLIKNMLAKTGGIHLSTPEEKHMVVGGGNRKMLLYSAHDSTLSRIMNTMGVFHPHNPPYAAAFMLELHWDSDHTDHYVKVFYRNETNRAPYELEIPSCSSPCFLSNLIISTEHLIPRDLKRECSLDYDEEIEEESRPMLRMAAPTLGNKDDDISRNWEAEASKGPVCVASHLPASNPWVITVVGMTLLILCILLWGCLFQLFGCKCKTRTSEGGGCGWSKNPWRSRGYGYEQL